MLKNIPIKFSIEFISICLKKERFLTIVMLIALLLGNSAYPQSHEYISLNEAVLRVESKQKQKWYVFPEKRENIIKWNDSCRTIWLDDKYMSSFSMDAKSNEAFVFQLAIWAAETSLKNIDISFSNFTDRYGNSIPAKSFHSFSTEGFDSSGIYFSQKSEVLEGTIHPLWVGVDLEKIKSGFYSGDIIVRADSTFKKVPVAINIKGKVLSKHRFDKGNSLSRLFWLNSRLGIDDDVTEGYVPIDKERNTLYFLGRSVEINEYGLPEKINSYFSDNNEDITHTPTPILNSPFQFLIEREDGTIIELKPGQFRFTDITPAYVLWETTNSSPECDVKCTGRLEFDGFAEIHLGVKAKQSLKIKDIRLEAHWEKNKAIYMMGLGKEGGLRTDELKWKWDSTKRQDNLWMGGVNGGLAVKLKSEPYRQPVVLGNYRHYPLLMPQSWDNDGKGGIKIVEEANNVKYTAYSGQRTLDSTSILHFNIELLITPFKKIEKGIKYHDRYYHGAVNSAISKIPLAKNAEANILNIHHGEDAIPFINYPYHDETIPILKQVIDKAHNNGLRLKVYYTTRELTVNCPEFYALKSLNGEIILPGTGNNYTNPNHYPTGPPEWMLKNLRYDYIPAWHTRIRYGRFMGMTDYSVITTPGSRLNNFYIEGLDWMLNNLKIDGIYIDDTHLDRNTIRRARKLIDQYRPDGRIDMHSYNHLGAITGRSSSLNMYMDLLPYIDLVWIGENRNYDKDADIWLVEVSGIPFGLTGQMLKGGGNPWRGMVFGITRRSGRSTKVNLPTALWQFWDQHSFKSKSLIGYWDDACPVIIDNNKIKASVFKGEDESIIAIANWGDRDEDVSLKVNWEKLGFNEDNVKITIPFIEDFQEAIPIDSIDKLLVPSGKGFLITISNI